MPAIENPSLGSSPRGRGKPGNHRLLRREPGLIPARAGKTARCPHGACSAAAHPRAGGENVIASSLEQYTRRLIPARAGKTRRNRPPRLTTRAHPRAGGENASLTALRRADNGSSPRGRGKPELTMEDATALGLIPARAGKTMGSHRSLWGRWAHPRAGGENALCRSTKNGRSGSSPRGRGKRRPRSHEPRRTRLIPARAGKTAPHGLAAGGPRAHPRAGGENIVDKPNILAGLGSSPRGRGKRKQFSVYRYGAGLIPARAGKTGSRRRWGQDGGAHPRAGGENSS